MSKNVDSHCLEHKNKRECNKNNTIAGNINHLRTQRCIPCWNPVIKIYNNNNNNNNQTMIFKYGFDLQSSCKNGVLVNFYKDCDF